MLRDFEGSFQGVIMSDQKFIPSLVSANIDTLELAARAVKDLCSRIDSGEEVSAAVEAAFDDTQLILADAVDRNIEAIKTFEKSIKEHKERLAQAQASLRTFEAAYEGLREVLAERIEQNQEVEYRGSLGLIVLRVPEEPSLEFVWKTFGPTAIKAHRVPERFYLVKPKPEYKLDAKAVKAALDAGEELSWCSLKFKKIISIRKG